MFIGYYSIANGVTLFGLLSAVTACFLAANGDIKYAIYMLFLACICDLFDGKIARTTKNRSDEEKFYGIQLDSLCDAISFGVTPCFIAYSFGFKGWFDILIYGIFIVCGVIRLAYFNTMANKNPGKKVKFFRGVPIPMSTFLVTLLFTITTFSSPAVSVWFFRLGYLAMAIAFIFNIKVKKPNTKRALTLLAVEIVMLIILAFGGDCKAPVREADVDQTVETGESIDESSTVSE